MANEEFGTFLIFSKHACIGLLKSNLEVLAEESEESDEGNYRASGAEEDVIEIEPTEDHEGDGGHEKDERNKRWEVEPTAVGLSGSGI